MNLITTKALEGRKMTDQQNNHVRVPVSKKLRFEVFKRDKFTCQYCGARAPEAILQCDHIVPVASGGATDILNLTTSCQPCNSGKGKRELSDDQAVTKQVDMLVELEERRQQIEMMLQWRDDLASLDDQTLEAVVERISAKSNLEPNEVGRATLKKLLKKYGLSEVLQGIDESFRIHLIYNEDGTADADSWGKALNKVASTIDRIREEVDKPYVGRLLYIQGIIRKRARRKNYRCFDYLEHAHKAGLDLDEMERRAKRMRSLEDFEAPIDEWLAEIGSPY